MGKVGLLSTINLVKTLEQAVITPNWRKCMARIGASEQTAMVWRAKSIKAMADNDRSSFFFLEWRETWDYWHQHMGRARIESLFIGEALLRDQHLNGIQSVVRGADQKILYQERPEYIGRSDEFVMLSEGCEPDDVPRARLLFDSRGHPLPQLKTEQLPSPLRLRILEQDRRYVERKEIDSQVQVTTTAKPFERLPGEERPNQTRLRQLAAMPAEERRKAINASAVPLNANGHRTMPPTGLPSARDDNLPTIEKPSPFARYEPPDATVPNAPRPSYARPTQRLDTGERTGRGDVPAGGMKVV